MRDLTLNYAVIAGILLFVGRLQVFPSLGDAFIAGLLATATVAVALVAFDTLVHRVAEEDSTTPAPIASDALPHQRHDA